MKKLYFGSLRVRCALSKPCSNSQCNYHKSKESLPDEISTSHSRTWFGHVTRFFLDHWILIERAETVTKAGISRDFVSRTSPESRPPACLVASALDSPPSTCCSTGAGRNRGHRRTGTVTNWCWRLALSAAGNWPPPETLAWRGYDGEPSARRLPTKAWKQPAAGFDASSLARYDNGAGPFHRRAGEAAGSCAAGLRRGGGSRNDGLGPRPRGAAVAPTAGSLAVAKVWDQGRWQRQTRFRLWAWDGRRVDAYHVFDAMLARGEIAGLCRWQGSHAAGPIHMSWTGMNHENWTPANLLML